MLLTIRCSNLNLTMFSDFLVLHTDKTNSLIRQSFDIIFSRIQIIPIHNDPLSGSIIVADHSVK